MRGDTVHSRLAARIASSPHQITVHYPPVRVGATGVVPFTQPASPLTRAPVPSTVPTPDTVGGVPDLTVQCLWYDRDALRTLPKFVQDGIGWTEDVEAAARVLATDVALDATNPWGGTKLDTAEYVQYNGYRYRIKTIKPISASFLVATTYAVLLTGGYKQP